MEGWATLRVSAAAGGRATERRTSFCAVPCEQQIWLYSTVRMANGGFQMLGRGIRRFPIAQKVPEELSLELTEVRGLAEELVARAST